MAFAGAALIYALGSVACSPDMSNSIDVELRPSLEDVLPNGAPYTPGTQSLLRHKHWLETVKGLSLSIDTSERDDRDDARNRDLTRQGRANVRLEAEADSSFIELTGVPLDYLVPRFHYRPSDPPDAFDAFNLMLAEFSRNGMSVPVGEPGDTMAHFETDLTESFPWTLAGDYEFLPNAKFRPTRIALVNNCLRSGLWEVSASDRSSEIYHAWFDFPFEVYFDLVAKTNRVDPDMIESALAWKVDPVELQLDRLRESRESLGEVSLTLAPETDSGYSSQDSRRKLKMGFALLEVEDGNGGTNLRRPERLSELTKHPVHLSNFDEPGKYRIEGRRRFDFGFLREVESADVYRVSPRTDYAFNNGAEAPDRSDETYLELHLRLRDRTIVIGNLPLELLVPQADFAIHGFGVGVLPSQGFAERRKFLIEEGPAPSFAYLCKRENGQRADGPMASLLALNSHELGLEQIFLRTHLSDDRAWWEVTLTSYERIVDLVKYEVEIPQSLRGPLDEARMRYIAPLHQTYRDDNLR